MVEAESGQEFNQLLFCTYTPRFTSNDETSRDKFIYQNPFRNSEQIFKKSSCAKFWGNFFFLLLTGAAEFFDFRGFESAI